MIKTKELIKVSILSLIVKKRTALLEEIRECHSERIFHQARETVMNSLDNDYYSRFMSLLNNTLDFSVEYDMYEEDLLAHLHNLSVNPLQIRREDTPGTIPWNYFSTVYTLKELGLLMEDIEEK